MDVSSLAVNRLAVCPASELELFRNQPPEAIMASTSSGSGPPAGGPNDEIKIRVKTLEPAVYELEVSKQVRAWLYGKDATILGLLLFWKQPRSLASIHTDDHPATEARAGAALQRSREQATPHLPWWVVGFIKKAWAGADSLSKTGQEGFSLHHSSLTEPTATPPRLFAACKQVLAVQSNCSSCCRKCPIPAVLSNRTRLYRPANAERHR
jgi:hypothetical protein